VFGHEHTRLGPKEDRLRLLKEVKANLSPIFSLVYDKKSVIKKLYEQKIKKQPPFIDVTDEDKNTHKLWRISNPGIIKKITGGLSKENVFIADGHHRYEVACIYRQKMLKKIRRPTGKEGFNFVLSYFTDTNSDGLSILAIHRLIKLKSNFNMAHFRARLTDYFRIKDFSNKQRFFSALQKMGEKENVFGVYKDKKYLLLILKDKKILARLRRQKAIGHIILDVSLLNHIVFENVLGITPADKEKIFYSTEPDELIKQVDSRRSLIAFFLNPVKINQIISVALRKEKMPAKSTYFYPKVISGLVINKLE